MTAIFEVKLRLRGSVTVLTIKAENAARAREQVLAQFAGISISIIHTRRIH